MNYIKNTKASGWHHSMGLYAAIKNKVTFLYHKVINKFRMMKRYPRMHKLFRSVIAIPLLFTTLLSILFIIMTGFLVFNLNYFLQIMTHLFPGPVK